MDMKADRISTTKRISIKRIKCNEFELHKKERGIKVLRESIARKGLLVPITVRHEGDHYMIVDGTRRFAAWQEEYPGQPIACTVLSYEADDASASDGEGSNEQMKQDAFTINLARAKVPRKQVEMYVEELHSRGMGYEAIAQCIGYKKSGIQKMIHRLKEKKGMLSVPVPAKKQTISNIRNVRKRLQNLAKELNVDNDADKKLFLDIEDWLKAQEDLMQDEMASETASEQDNTVDADTAEDQPQQT